MADIDIELQKQVYKYYMQGLTSTEIAKKLNIRREVIDNYYHFLLTKYPRIRKRSKEPTSIPENKIAKDYASGKSKIEIGKKYHIGSEKVEDIVNSFPESIKKKHEENVNINKGEILNKAKEEKEEKIQYHGDVIKSPERRIYCVVILENQIMIGITTDPTRRNYQTHLTDFLTFRIRSKSDISHYENSLDMNADNLPDTFTPYCFDAESGNTYTLNEIKYMYGYPITYE